MGRLDVLELVLSACGIAVILLYLLYAIVRGMWLCVWDSYVEGPLERRRLERDAERAAKKSTLQLTSSYTTYQNAVIDAGQLP
jgi:hypothetical protein